MKKQIILFLLLPITLGTFISCEKQPVEEEPRILQEGDYTVHTGKTIKAVVDSLYLYAQEIYLWNEKLPPINVFMEDFYADIAIPEGDEKADRTVALALSRIVGITKHSDRASAIYRVSDKQLLSRAGSYIPPSASKIDERKYIDNKAIGIIIERNFNDNYRIKMVRPGSPAHLAGLKRGQVITSVIENEGSVYFKTLPDNQLIALYKNLDYKPKAVLFESTIDLMIEGNTVGTAGYMVLDHFSDKGLREAFTVFKEDNISALVIDLRYNDGKNTTVDYYPLSFITDMILPKELKGQSLFKEHYNKVVKEKKENLMQQKEWWKYFRTNIDNEGFRPIAAPIGTYADPLLKLVNLKTIVFITSERTDGLAEMLVNGMRPFADRFQFRIGIIGKSTKGGAAINTIPVRIGNYDIHFAAAVVKNSAGQEMPSGGINPDFNVDDNLSFELGDPEEPCLNMALQYLSTWHLKPNPNLDGPLPPKLGYLNHSLLKVQ